MILNQTRLAIIRSSLRATNGLFNRFNQRTLATETSPTAPATDAEASKAVENLKAFSKIEQMHMRRLNEINQERYLRQAKMKKMHRFWGAGIGAFVLTVYFYTMYAINQEKFLDDFEPPVPPDPAAQNPQK